MCRVVTCKRCGRPTWAGCGAHVEQVLGSVPAADRCQCRAASGAKAAPKSGAPAGTTAGRSWLARVLKR